MDTISTTSTIIDHALTATPYNAVGYGLLVAILISANIAQWRSNSKLHRQLTEERNDTLNDVRKLRNALEKERRERDRQDT